MRNVIPTKVGIHLHAHTGNRMDPDFRRDDRKYKRSPNGFLAAEFLSLTMHTPLPREADAQPKYGRSDTNSSRFAASRQACGAFAPSITAPML